MIQVYSIRTMHASFDRWICHRKMNPTELTTIEPACNLRKKYEKSRANTNISDDDQFTK